MNKFSKILFFGGLFLFLFPTSLVTAEPLKESSTNESTLGSVSEDLLLKNDQTVELTRSSQEESTDTSSDLIESKDTLDPIIEGSQASEIQNQTAESIVTQAESDVLIEGLPGDASYDIDKNFADAIRRDLKAAPRPMTRTFMKSITSLDVSNQNLSSLKGIELATALWHLFCQDNQLTSLDISKNQRLGTLECQNNQLTSLDISQNSINYLTCSNNQITSFGEGPLPASTGRLICDRNQLTSLDTSKCRALAILICGSNPLTSIDLNQCVGLTEFDCSNLPQLDILNLRDCKNLEKLNCSNNQLQTLSADFFLIPNLKELYCSNNQLTNLDVSRFTGLQKLECQNNQLSQLTNSGNKKLVSLNINNNNMTDLNMSDYEQLETLNCSNNQLTKLNLTKCIALSELDCSSNQLADLTLSSSKNLTKLDCSNNQLKDITSANGLNLLTTLNAKSQAVTAPRPFITEGKATIDVLRTTAQTGLTSTNGTISPTPVFNYSGDKILLSNLTTASLVGKRINFFYNGSKLSEGASSGTKSFDGTISFYDISELSSELKPSQRKIHSGQMVEWTWKIKSLAPIKAQDVRATLNLPAGLKIDQTSIKKNGVAASMSDIDGTNNLGVLNEGSSITFTFKTTATGRVDDQLKANGRVEWKDETNAGPYVKETINEIQIFDDQQSYTPKDDKNLALVSTPLYFNYGIQDIYSTTRTHSLDSTRYQTNTNVETKGFYTRMKDDRPTSTGWKLTAQLSDFTDIYGRKMPNSAGASVNFNNLSIERIINRDTSQETIDPLQPGRPSTVEKNATLIVGQSAKILISAKTGEGQGTWQLRMPFSQITLRLPANAGEKSTVYNAKLTWSLNDTP